MKANPTVIGLKRLGSPDNDVSFPFLLPSLGQVVQVVFCGFSGNTLPTLHANLWRWAQSVQQHCNELAQLAALLKGLIRSHNVS